MPRPEGSRGAQVRTRVLGGLVVLTALALAVSGLTAYSLERLRLDRGLDTTLELNARELTELAANGLDPDTGAPFASVRVLLRTGLQRIAMSPNEGILAYVDGSLSNTAPSTVALRLEHDADLMLQVQTIIDDQLQQAAADGPLPPGTRTFVRTPETDYRLVALPVRIPGDDSVGTLVMAFDHRAEHRQLADTFGMYAAVAVVALLAITAIGWVIVGRLLRPIRLLREAAQTVSSSDLSQRIPVAGRDDMAALTRTFNEMLERLEGAFASQRQLLDDAGHELRTPLTIVQGHLELMDPADPQDALATKDVVLDELGRMNRLVDDLMTLARSRRPDFVTTRPTDVAGLTDDVLAKARHLGERRWILEGLAEVTQPLDPQRMTQAMLQLCANAVRFSEPGSVIAIGSRVEPGWVYLWVRDEGVGIAQDDVHRIFDRFERLHPDVEGSGLGLTIVRSIVQAHGGEVRVHSAQGVGTTMTVALPATQTPAVSARENA